MLGTYDPALADGKAIVVKTDRVDAWLCQGAILSEALRSLFKHHGIAVKAPAKAASKAKAKAKADKKVVAKKDGKTFVPATRRAVKKHAAKLKVERLVKTTAAVEAAKAAKAAAAAAAAAAAEAPKA